MSRKPSEVQLIVLGLMGFLMASHIGMLAYAFYECKAIVHRFPDSERCKNIGDIAQGAADAYLAILLALLVPISNQQD